MAPKLHTAGFPCVFGRFRPSEECLRFECPGDPLFMTFDGNTIAFGRKDREVPEKYEKVYALFVNEAAYYEKKAERSHLLA